jgi:SAM-dependent methyltransferase
MLAQWAIPDDLVAAAPRSPYFFDPVVFTEAADDAVRRNEDTLSDRVAREALPPGGEVLDVGVGAGAASLRLAAGRVIGVDPSAVLLDAFSERAARLGIPHMAIQGAWPDVASRAPVADVAVCHHVAYNIADLASFAQALTEHTTMRVVLELTAVHPMSWLAPYWKALHDISQPECPIADDAIAVLAELGLVVHHERWRRRIQMIGESGDERLLRIARRLCLSPDRYDELRAQLVDVPPPLERDVVTIWWQPHSAITARAGSTDEFDPRRPSDPMTDPR